DARKRDLLGNFAGRRGGNSVKGRRKGGDGFGGSKTHCPGSPFTRHHRYRGSRAGRRRASRSRRNRRYSEEPCACRSSSIQRYTNTPTSRRPVQEIPPYRTGRQVLARKSPQRPERRFRPPGVCGVAHGEVQPEESEG